MWYYVIEQQHYFTTAALTTDTLLKKSKDANDLLCSYNNVYTVKNMLYTYNKKFTSH